MADYQAHINQAKKNLAKLSDISLKIDDIWDWQVTICYYVGVHLMNAHLAKTVNQHYKTHVDVKNALFNNKWPSVVPEDVYVAYTILENHSRRARYLCHEDIKRTEESVAYQTYDKHLKKAVKNLEIILNFFTDAYGEKFETCRIDCIELKSAKLQNFKYVQSAFAEK